MYNSGMVLSLAINASSIFEKFPLSAMPVSFNISRRVNPVRRSSNDRHVVLFFCKYKKYIDCRQIKTCFSFKLVNLRQKALDVVHALCTQEKANRQVAFMSNLAIILGRDYWTRTSDLAPPRRVRYQLR